MERIEESLNDCIERMAAGEPLDSCLASYPDMADELKPLLELSHAVTETSMSIKPRGEFKAAARHRFHAAMAEKGSKVAKAKAAFRGWRFKWATVAVAALVVFVVGGGMGVSSANSMPGDMLYGVKTFAEQIRMGLTFGSENKAQLHLQLAEERSEEIQTLVEEGNLEAANDIGVELTNHLEKAQQVAPRLLENGDLVARLETIANKQVVLLEAIYDRVPTGAQETVNTLIESVNDAYEIAMEDISTVLPDIEIVLNGTLTQTADRLDGTIEIANNSNVDAEISDVVYSITTQHSTDDNLWSRAKIVRHNRNTMGGLETGTMIEAGDTDTFNYIIHISLPEDATRIRGRIAMKLEGRDLLYFNEAIFTIPSLQSVESLTVAP